MRTRDFKDGRKVFIITGHESNPANLYIKEVYLMKGIIQLNEIGMFVRVDNPKDTFLKYFIGYDSDGNYYPINPITTFKDKDTAKTMLRIWLRKAFYREINHIWR